MLRSRWTLLVPVIGLACCLPLVLGGGSDGANPAEAAPELDDGATGAEGSRLDDLLLDGAGVPSLAEGDAFLGDWLDPDLQEPEDVQLSALRADPGPWCGRRVRFHFQFAGPRASWEPFLSRFGPEQFVAVSAWGDDESPWEPEVYANPIGSLFARRGEQVEASLALARKHQRFLAVGVVRDVFVDEPWIELQSIERTVQHVPEGTLLHVQKARGFQRLEQWDLALDQLQRAMSAPLPAHALAGLQALEAEVERLQGEQDARRSALR